MTTEAQMREQFYKRMDAELYDLFHSMAHFDILLRLRDLGGCIVHAGTP